MNYRFESKEKIGEGFVRILDEISRRAAELGRHRDASLGEAIHDTRVLGKRLRALLWFAQPVLAERIHDQAKKRLREASGVLAPMRDDAVVCAVLEKHQEKSKSHDRMALEMLIEGTTESSVTRLKLRAAVRRAITILQRVAADVKKGAAAQSDWPRPRSRVKEAWCEMKQAARKARRSGEDEAYHEWRKKTKRLLYQMELAGDDVKTVDKLQDELGLCHDLAVVEDRLRRANAPAGAVARVARLFKKTKARARAKAAKLGRKI